MLWYPFSHLPKGLVLLALWGEKARESGYVWLWGTALSLRRIRTAGPDTDGKFPVVFECRFGEVFQEPNSWACECFCCVGKKGIILGIIGSCSSTLLSLGLASDFLCVLVKGMVCIAISALGGIVTVGFGKSLGSSIPTSMHAALLKYRRLLFFFFFLYMYRACLVVFSVDDGFHGEPTLTHECKASYSWSDFPWWDEVVRSKLHIQKVLRWLFSVISRTVVGGGLTPLQRCSRYILQILGNPIVRILTIRQGSQLGNRGFWDHSVSYKSKFEE